MSRLISSVFLSAFLFSSAMLNAQGITLGTQKTYGGTYSDKLQSAVLLSNGDILVGGESRSGISGDKTETFRGQEDYWIICFDEALNEKWQKTYGGDSMDRQTGMLQTLDGGILCGGFSSSTVSGDKTAAKKGGHDYWVIKFDSSGTEMWQKTYGGLGEDYLDGMAEFEDGKLLFFGQSNSGISGDKSDSSRGSYDYWLVMTDASGNILWDKTIGGSGFENASSVAITASSEIIVSGISLSNMSGEKTENNYGFDTNVWLLKLDSSGNIIWDKTLGGSDSQLGPGSGSNNLGFSAAIGDEIFILSQSNADSSGTKTEDARGEFDYWITKLDKDGAILWDKTIGGDDYEVPRTLFVNSNGELLISGYSLSNISGDKTENTNGIHDYWLVALDTTTGAIKWQKTIGGSDYDALVQTVETSPGKYVLAGWSRSGISGDKTGTSRGVEDYWLVELYSPTGIDKTAKYSKSFSFYPNPTKGEINIKVMDSSQEKYTLYLFDINGKWIMERDIEIRDKISVPQSLSEGIYLLNVKDRQDRNVASGRIIIQHP